jgi:hypothetical protein
VPFDASSGLPESGIFRLCFRSRSHVSKSSRFQAFSNPQFLLLLLHRRPIPEFPRLSHPPAFPLMPLQVSPNLASSGCTVSASSSVPESCFHGWVDDDSLAGLELRILDPRSRMNLRVLPGLAHSCQTLDAFSISIRPSAAVSSCVPPSSIQFRIVLFGGNCVSRLLLGHQLIRSLGRNNLWKQVQKRE